MNTAIIRALRWIDTVPHYKVEVINDPALMRIYGRETNKHGTHASLTILSHEIGVFRNLVELAPYDENNFKIFQLSKLGQTVLENDT